MVNRGAGLKAEARNRPERRTEPCQYKDKSSRPQPSNAREAPTGPGRDDAGWKGGNKSTSERRGGASASAPESRAEETSRVTPKHVQHCFNKTSRWDWIVCTWKKDAAALKRRRPYTCNSWRCEGERWEPAPKTGELRLVNPCARHEASVTFARMKEACERPELAPDGWVFFVLTLDREGYYTGEGRRWPDVTAAFRELGELSHRFLTRLRGVQKRNGWSVTRNQWIATVEAHRNGWPHVNVMVWCPELAAELREDRELRERRGRKGRELILIDGPLREVSEGAGWGRQSTAEAARSVDALLGYITKLSGAQMGRSIAELAKLTQLPTKAPERFRRLRAGKCFLPPRRKDPTVTGTLLRRGRDQWGLPLVLPLHAAQKNPELAAHVAECCYNEERVWISELAIPRLLAVRAKPRLVSTFSKAALEREREGNTS